MDQVTKLYYYKSLQLQEHVAQLERKLQLLSEEPTTAPKYGRGKRSGLVGGSPTAQGDEDVDFTGGNVDPKSGAWTPSSGGPAVADSEAGDIEIENRMRGIARGGGLFGKGVEQTEQTPAYMEMKGELERRRAAREAAKKGGGQQKPQATQPTDGAGTKGGAGAVSSGKASGTSGRKAGTGTSGTGTPGAATGQGAGDGSRKYSMPVSPTTKDQTTSGSEDGSGIDPKLIVLGAAGAGLAGKAVYDRYARQRGQSGKPAETAKAGETAKPKAAEGAKPAEAAKSAEAPKTQAGKTPAPKAPKPKVGENIRVPGSMQKGTYLFDLPAQAEWTMNPPEWEMKGREKFSVPQTSVGRKKPLSKPGLERAAGTPMTGSIPEKPLPAETTIDGKQVSRGPGSVADRAALGRDRLRARADAAKAAAAEASAQGQAKPTAQAAEVKAPEVKAPEVQAGSFSTKDGKVVTPKAAGQVIKGAEVTSKVAKLGRGVARFGLVDLPAMMAAGAAGKDVAKSLGAGTEDAEIAGTLASFAPMAASPVVAAAAAPGYILGKLGEKGMRATGADEALYGKPMRAIANAWSTEERKGYEIPAGSYSTKDGKLVIPKGAGSKVWNPQTGKYQTAEEAAASTKEQAKMQRRTDITKGFAGQKEAEEFAKQMQDPEFRRRHEHAMGNAYVRELERQAGGSAISARAMGAAPDWIGAPIEAAGKAIEAGEEALGSAIEKGAEYVPGGQWVLGKAGQFMNWLNK
jgi:hypothetical protein